MSKQIPTLRFAQRSDITQIIPLLKSFGHNTYFFYPLQNENDRLQQDLILKWVAFNQIAISPRQTLVAESTGFFGLITLAEIDWRSRNAALEMVLPPGELNTELSAKVIAQVFDYAFNQLGMHKLYAYVPASQKEVIAKYDKAGMKPEVLYRRHISIQNRLEDVYVYSFFSKKI